MTNILFLPVQEQIKDTIKLYEKRATLVDVEVTSALDESTIRVLIYFYINSVEQPISLTVFLERTR